MYSFIYVKKLQIYTNQNKSSFFLDFILTKISDYVLYESAKIRLSYQDTNIQISIIVEIKYKINTYLQLQRNCRFNFK